MQDSSDTGKKARRRAVRRAGPPPADAKPAGVTQAETTPVTPKPAGESPWQRTAPAQSSETPVVPSDPVEAPEAAQTEIPAAAPTVSLAKAAGEEPAAAPAEPTATESAFIESAFIESTDDGNTAGEAQPSRIRRISRGARRFVLSRRGGAAALVIVVLALLGTGGWLLWENHQHNQLEAKRNAYMATATQEVLNTLNIQKDSADADVKRILDNASGSFYDQFNSNRDQFVNIVKEAEVNSKGNVVQAAVQDISGNTARVLVVGSSEVTNKASPQPTQRDYRLRVTVTDDGHRMTVSDMEYVMS